MSKKERLKLDIISNIDEKIIQDVSKKRIKLSKYLQKPPVGKRGWVAAAAIAALLALTVGLLWFFLLPTKQIPIYTGMTVSGEVPTSAQAGYPGQAQYLSVGAGDVWRDPAEKDMEKEKEKKEKLKKALQDKLDAQSAESLYYAKPGEEVYVTIHIDNPDDFEILSFTLNGQKYSSYMFEDGSDMENIIIKVNVGDASGIAEYTIDAIKYVDGTKIKDVRMDGDRTVRVGIYTENQPTVKIESETLSYDRVSFDVTVSDPESLISMSHGKLFAVLYEGENVKETFEIGVGEKATVSFANLIPDTSCQYALVAYYDAFDGNGMDLYILEQREVTTLPALSFASLQITQEEIAFALDWNAQMQDKTLLSLKLYQNGNLVKELSTDATKAESLLSNTAYTLVAEYSRAGLTETVTVEFTTLAKATPDFIISNPTKTQTSVGFEIEETDVDNVGAITKIELLQGESVVKTAEDLTVRGFDGLLSNNAYSVRVTYVYDLNDGAGAHTVEKTLEFTTVEKAIPAVSIEMLDRVTDLENNKMTVQFNIAIQDADGVITSYEASLYQGDALIAKQENQPQPLFADLNNSSEHIMELTYQYDLNDGKGVQAQKLTMSTWETSKGLAIQNGEITGIGSCTDTVLYINQPIKKESFAGLTQIEGVFLTGKVKSIPERAFQNCSNLTSVVISDSVTSIGDYAFNGCTGFTSIAIPDSVTSIGGEAFSGCSNLTSITIPDSVTSIGTQAFGSCTGLTSVILGKGVTIIGYFAFRNCTSLTSITIPDSVTSIGDYAFNGCNGLTSITIPDSVTSIGDSAFSGCTSLTSITIPNSVTSIGYSAFENCASLTSITIGNGVTSLSGFAFQNYKNLTSVAIGNGVTSIGDYAFYNCPGLTSITIPDSVTSIGDHAFNGCTGLKSVTIPDSVTSIGTQAFDNCTGLTSVILGNGVTSIGDHAFCWCTGLISITIPNSVTSIGNDAFNSCEKLTSITIPDSVTSIGNYAFYSCARLTSITIPDSVTSIGDFAFSGCTELKTVYYTGTVEDWAKINIDSYNDKLINATQYYYSETEPAGEGTYWHYVDGVLAVWKESYFIGIALSDGTYSIAAEDINNMPAEVIIPSTFNGKVVTMIANNAFRNCTSLTSITIPDSVTSIGDYAFYNCTGLTSVILGNGVTSIGYGAFDNCTGIDAVYYTGTNADWTKISIGYENSYLSGNRYYYSAIEPDGGNCWRYVDGVPTPWPPYYFVLKEDGTYGFGMSFEWDRIPSEIVIPSTHNGKAVTVIESDAFLNCTSVISITIPNSITHIDNYAFYGCTGLTSITIPDSVISIGYEAFRDCTNLTSITIPDSVTSIGNNAFYNCYSLTSITIPNSVTSIGDRAFYNCVDLTTVTIPNSVTSIGNSAFSRCFSMQNVCYVGTAEEWETIQIGDDNAWLTDAARHYFSKDEPVIPPAVIEPMPDVWDGTADTGWFDINNPQSVYVLTTAEQLAGFIQLRSDFKNTYCFEGVTIKLARDIILNEGTAEEIKARGAENLKWKIVGSGYLFKGIFDGMGHTISGVYIDCTSSASRGTLGSVGDNAVIKNLKIQNAYFNGSEEFPKNTLGILAARANGQNILISNVTIEDVLMDEGTAKFSGVGLLVGSVDSNASLTVENCHTSGTISFPTKGTKGFGGIIGNVQDATLSMINCTSSATVIAPDNCGGLIGVVSAKSNVTLGSGCTFTGTIICEGENKSDYVGNNATIQPAN